MIDRQLIKTLAAQYNDKVRLAQDQLGGVQNICQHPEIREFTDKYHRPAQECVDCMKIIWPHRKICYA